MKKISILSKSMNYGLSIFFEGEQTHFHLLTMTMDNDKMKIEGLHYFQSIEDLVQNLNPKIPLSLFIGGDKVIIKKVGKNIEDVSGVFAQIPGIKSDDFIYDYKNFSDYSFVGILRKTEFETIKEYLNQNRILIVSIELIPSFDGEEIRLNANEYESLLYGFYKLETLGKNVMNVEPSMGICDYSFGENQLNSLYFPAYTIAKQFSTNGKYQTTSNFSDFENYFYKKRTKTVMMFSLSILFCLLILGIFLNQKYTSELQQLQQTRHYQLKEKKIVDSLSLEINKLSKLIKDKQTNGGTQLSFIADRIASAVPPNIQLTDFQIFPSNVKNNKLDLQKNMIVLQGKSSRNLALTELITKIKEFSWVENVKIAEYHKDIEKEYANFSVNIDFNNEKLN